MDRPARDDDALLTLAFSVRSSPGAYALLLGAGVSAPSGIPTAWGVLEDLTSRVAQLAGEQTDDPVSWYESRYEQPARYETLLEKVAPTTLERQRLLKGFFEPSTADIEAGRRLPTPAHRAIARMVSAGSIKVIVTLNFDRLIEQAIRDHYIEPTVVSSPADIEGMAPLHTLDCCVVHLHGDYLNPTSMLNTTSELQAYHARTVELLHRILQDYGLIIAGWSSIHDPSLRAAIAAHYPSRLTLVWIEPLPPSTEATELRTLKKGLLLSTDADTGFGQLADAVDALNARDARHPLTVAVAVETAKRELSGRQVAIGLHDTLKRELARLHDHRDFHLTDYQDAASVGGYEAIVDRVGEASKVPCALVATLSYWGNPSTDEWWIDEIERLTTQVRGSGLVKLLAVKYLAAAAVYYSAGVAAIYARRYGVLARLLNTRRGDPYTGEAVLLAVTLDADRAYSEAVGHGTRLLGALRPLLREALAIGDEALDDAWQSFEILRMAKATMADVHFESRLADYLDKRAAVDEAQRRFADAERTGVDVDPAREERATAWQNHGTVLGYVASSVRLWRPHIFTVDARGNDGYRSPIADRLAADLSAEADSHPLIRANVAANAAALGLAIGAVSVAAGGVGYKLAWARIAPGRGGEVPMEIWADADQTPERRSPGV